MSGCRIGSNRHKPGVDLRSPLGLGPSLSLALLLAACASVQPVPRADFVHALQGSDVTRLETMLAAGGAPLEATTAEGKTVLMVMAGAGRADAVARLLDAGMAANQPNKRGGTALMFAAVSGNTVVVNQLLTAGADVNAIADNGWTAIALAAAKGYTPVVQQLLGAKADANVPDMYGWTPLMRAVEHGKSETVAVLLRAPGIEIDAVNDNGASALFRATVAANEALIRMLLEQGADPTLEDHQGRSPRSVARMIERPDLENLLLNGG